MTKQFRKVVSGLSVKVGRQQIAYVDKGTDKSSYEALKVAEKLFMANKYKYTEAIIDRFDGMVLLCPKDQTGQHFVTAICGYYGSGPMVSAQILEMFGFGDYDYTLAKIAQGGDMASFHVIKDRGFLS